MVCVTQCFQQQGLVPQRPKQQIKAGGRAVGDRDRSMDPFPTALALPAARVQAQHWAQCLGTILVVKPALILPFHKDWSVLSEEKPVQWVFMNVSIASKVFHSTCTCTKCRRRMRLKTGSCLGPSLLASSKRLNSTTRRSHSWIY